MLDNKSSLPNHIELTYSGSSYTFCDQEHKPVDTEALLPRETRA